MMYSNSSFFGYRSLTDLNSAMGCSWSLVCINPRFFSHGNQFWYDKHRWSWPGGLICVIWFFLCHKKNNYNYPIWSRSKTTLDHNRATVPTGIWCFDHGTFCQESDQNAGNHETICLQCNPLSVIQREVANSFHIKWQVANPFHIKWQVANSFRITFHHKWQVANFISH